MFATDWKQLTVLFLGITKNIMTFILPSVRPQIKTGTCVVNLPSISRKNAIGPNKLMLNQAGNLCQTWPRLVCVGDSWLCPALQLGWLLSQTKVQASLHWGASGLCYVFLFQGWFCVPAVWQQAPLYFVSSSAINFEACCHTASERISLNDVCFPGQRMLLGIVQNKGECFATMHF